jgi:hypothetical protein
MTVADARVNSVGERIASSLRYIFIVLRNGVVNSLNGWFGSLDQSHEFIQLLPIYRIRKETETLSLRQKCWVSIRRSD